MATEAREIAVPFAVDGLGRIAFTTDPYQQVLNRLTVLLSTRTNERVMVPTYGVDTLSYVFGVNDEVTMQRLMLEIEQAVRDWEPSVEVQSVQPQMDEDNGLLGVSVFFTLTGAEYGDLTVHEAYIQTGGTVVSSRG